jgi:hypothetical protein
MRRTTTAAIVAALGITLTTIGAAPAGAAPSSAATACAGPTVSTADLATGCAIDSGTLVLPDGRRFVVPAPGITVTAAPVVVAGGVDPGDVVIANSGRAGVAVQTGGEWAGSTAAVTRERAALQRRVLGASVARPSSVGAATTAAACGSTAYSLTGHRWSAPVQWRYNTRNAKAPNVPAVTAAANAWTGTITTCGKTVSSTASNRYLGATGRSPALTNAGGCGSSDGYSVVGWGTLPAGTLGVTCVWSRSGGVAFETDQRYSTRYDWRSTVVCSGNRFDLRGVATHEWGHVYGLGHVAVSTGQVMRPSATTCDVAQRTLGSGDARGISTLY